MATAKTPVTDEQIRDLIQEAAAAGDQAQVDQCHAALRGVRKARRAVEATIRNFPPGGCARGEARLG